MTTDPGTRFVRLRPADPRSAHVTATFLAAGREPPEPAGVAGVPDHGPIAAIAATDPERAERIRAGLRYLVANDHTVMTWLEAEPANTALFARDPETALRLALPDLPVDFFAGWRAPLSAVLSRGRTGPRPARRTPRRPAA